MMKILKLELQTPSIHDDVATKIISKANGNPLYLKELANDLKPQLKIKDGVITADVSKLQLPDNLKAILQASFDKLHPHEQMLLKVASVLGKRFDCSILPYIYPKDIHPILPCDPKLRALEEKGILKKTNLENNQHLHEFASTMLKQVVYKSMPEEYRKKIHLM